jgi:hypothetical protein
MSIKAGDYLNFNDLNLEVPTWGYVRNILVEDNVTYATVVISAGTIRHHPKIAGQVKWEHSRLVKYTRVVPSYSVPSHLKTAIDNRIRQGE